MKKIYDTLSNYIKQDGTIINKETGNIVKLTKNKCGYLVFGAITKSGKRKLFLYHRVKYHYLVRPIPKGMCINHLDGNKINNNLNNLEVTTYSGNNRHSREVLRNNPEIKLRTINNITLKKAIYLYNSGVSIKEISQRLKLHPSKLSQIFRGVRYKEFKKDVCNYWENRRKVYLRKRGNYIGAYYIEGGKQVTIPR